MDDLISRKAAIKAIENLQDCYNGFSDTYDKACIIGVLEEVPSAQRKGKWITHEYLVDGYKHAYCECTACGENRPITLFPLRFCPNCGADMRGEQDE